MRLSRVYMAYDINELVIRSLLNVTPSIIIILIQHNSLIPFVFYFSITVIIMKNPSKDSTSTNN